MIDNALLQLGYDQWFEEASKDFMHDNFTVARVTEVNKNNYRVSDGGHEILAELAGKLLFEADVSTDFPTVGDWVVIQVFDNYTLAIVHHILPRKSLLKRKESGNSVDFQLIASNLDYALIIQSADALNLNLLERYLVMANEGKIQPIIVLSKIDLLPESELAALHDKMKKLKIKYFLISNFQNQGITALSQELLAGKTYCLLGVSGVGKTTLLNSLLGEKRFRVHEVRASDGKGRHTTVKRQLICLESGSIFIDTPGMRELGNFAVDKGIAETFEDILLYEARCRFRNCTHTHEAGCAVIRAEEQGKIDSARYNNYLKIKKESEHYEMSYIEKRKRDRAFGKMIKNYKKSKLKKR